MIDKETNRSEDLADSKQPEQQKSVEAPAVPGPGAQLANFRKKGGMSVEYVASRMKMTVSQLKNLEADNYEAFHGIAISRGFVRAYAKLLQVDPEPLVALFPADKAATPVANKTPSQAKPVKRAVTDAFAGGRQPFRSRRGWPVKLIGLAVVVLIVAGVLVARQTGSVPFNLPLMQKSSKDAAAKETVPKTSLTPVAPASSSVATEVLPPKATVMSEGEPATSAPKQEAAPEPAPAPASDKAEAAPNITSGQGGNKLVLRFREDSWIQITGSDSEVRFERLVKAGETETFEIKEPVSVTIGYAPGVEASLRGAPIELRTAENSTVARLKLK